MDLLLNFFHFYYNSIGEEMIYDSKLKPPLARNSSNSSYFTRALKVPFRTVLKRRNDTISASQLYEDQSSSKSKNVSRHLSHSQIHSQKQIDLPPSPVAIKDYVKKMGIKAQPKRTQPKHQIIDQVKHEDDKISQRSSRSVMSNSHTLKKEVICAKEEKGSFEQLQKRVQTLINLTISQFKRQKSLVGITQWLKTEPQEDIYEKQLDELVCWIKQLGQKEEIPAQRLQDLNRKIGLIQKLLARQNVEAELLQGMYFNWKTQRGNTTSFLNKSVLKDSTKYNKPFAESHRRLFKQTNKQIVSKYNSTSALSFKRPSRQYYVIPKEKKNSYSANRQPFPRSSYSEQYFNYGQFATYSYKANDSIQYPQASLAVKASTYQEEYKEKLGLTKNIDFKELDCYKNKFHNSNISFMNASKKKANIRPEQRRHQGKGKQVKENLNAASIKKSQESLLGSMSMSCSHFFKSEHHKEYLWHNKTSILSENNNQILLKSQIKDKRLDRLKESFRALAMRR